MQFLLQPFDPAVLGRLLLVICSEREDNAAEHIATEVCNQFAIEPTTLTWVEHYPPGRAHGKREVWDLVAFASELWSDEHGALANPTWRPGEPADWLEIGTEPAELF